MADLKTTNIFGDAYINNKVGIATNAPATRLQIGQLSPTAATEGLQFGDDPGTRIYRSSAGTLTLSGSVAGLTLSASTALYGSYGDWSGESNKIQWHSNNLYIVNRGGGSWLFRNSSAANVFSIAADGGTSAATNINAGTYVYAGTYLQTNGNLIYPSGYGATQTLQVGNASGNAWIAGLSLAPGGNVTVYNNLTVNNAATVTNDLTVNGNTYLGNANNDTVYVNDTIRIGATDSGDASLFFGEGAVAGSDYGARWYWDSGYTFYWYTRNNGTDTQLFDYVTNDTSYINWRRHFHMQNKEINYNAQVHFNAGTRFVGNTTQYLIFRSDSTSAGGIQIQDGSTNLKGYIGYWDSNGGGILNNSGNWAVRYNFGSTNTGGQLYGDWTVANLSATGYTMTNLTGAYQNTTVYDSAKTQSATPSRGIRAPASSIQFTDSYAIAPYYTYRSTGDWPVPYGIGWGTGGESSGIFQRYASNGSSFGDMIFYTGNDGYGAFSFRRHTWEGTAHFAAGSGELSTELFRIDWAGNISMLGTLNGSANSATLYANNGTYGSWRIGGTRNSWYGLEFESGVSLMANSGEVGFYRNGSGWQMRWYNGAGYIYKSNPGGGTEAVILDSSNSPYANNMNQYVRTTDSPTFAVLQLTRLNFGATGAAPYNAASGEGYGNGITFGGDENSAAYRIFTGMENIGGNYSKLTLNWHTGIRIGAYFGYGGIRFYNNYVGTGTKVFSIAEGDDNVRVYNELFVQGSGIGAYNFMKYGGTRSGDWQLFTTSSVGAGQMNVIQVENIGGGGHTNYPTGVYTYGGVMSWRLPNHSFQLYAAHTGDLAYKTQWNNDNYSGWRRILDSSSYPYAANMNQYVRTTDGVTFANLYTTGDYEIKNTSPTITLRDTDHRTGFIHVNSNIFYVLTGVADSARGNWAQVANSRWPMELNLSTNNATFGADVNAISFTGAGTGLTGTASSLSIGGNAATATTLQTARAINGVSFNGSAAITVDGLNYSVNNAWLRENGDDAQFQMYGNSRTMIYRTDGNTNPHGGGAFAHIFYYGGSADANRMFIINTDGRLWSTYHGWLDTMSTTGNAANVTISNLASQLTTTSTLPAGAWYTVAVNSGDRASAKFTITNEDSGLHQAVQFYATAHYGTGTGAKISVVSNTYYAGPPIGNIRIMIGSTYDGAMLQVYTNNTCSIKISIHDNQQSGGWVIKSGVVSTSNPGGVSNYAALTTVAAQVELNSGKSFSVSDELYIGGTTTQYKALHANNYNSYSPTLTGTGASGTWGISVTGNAATATTTDNINGRAFYNRDSGNALAQDSYTNNGIGYVNSVSLFGQTDGGMYASAYSTSWIHQIYGDFRTGQIAIRGKNSGTWQSWRTVLDATNSPYAYNMNQNVRTADTVSFAAVSATTFTGALSGNATTATSATTATALNSSNYIARCGSSGNANTDFQNTPAGSVRHNGDDANLTNSPGGTWWFYDNYRHSNNSNYWGIQVAWGWEDNANKLATRNITGNSFGGWVYYLNSGNYNSYSPTLTGTGASGNWGINVTGTAASISGFGNPTTNSTANTIVYRDSNGYIQNNYFYTSGGGSERNASGMGYFAGFNTSDYYIRSYTAAAVAAAISGQTMNINGSSTSCSGNAATATTATTAGTANAVASAAVKAAGLDSSVEFTMTGLTSNSTIKIFPSYVSPYSSFLRMGYDNTGNYEYTIKRDGTTGFLEFYNTQANYTGYYFRINGSGGGLGIAVSPASRLHVNGDGTNPAVRVDNTGVVLAASVGSNGRTFYGWLPISVDGTTRWIRIFS